MIRKPKPVGSKVWVRTKAGVRHVTVGRISFVAGTQEFWHGFDDTKGQYHSWTDMFLTKELAYRSYCRDISKEIRELEVRRRNIERNLETLQRRLKKSKLKAASHA